MLATYFICIGFANIDNNWVISIGKDIRVYSYLFPAKLMPHDVSDRDRAVTCLCCSQDDGLAAPSLLIVGKWVGTLKSFGLFTIMKTSANKKSWIHLLLNARRPVFTVLLSAFFIRLTKKLAYKTKNVCIIQLDCIQEYNQSKDLNGQTFVLAGLLLYQYKCIRMQKILEEHLLQLRRTSTAGHKIVNCKSKGGQL